jgi:hypothetical protein
MVMGTLPTGSIISCNRQPSAPDIVHDHIRFHKRQVCAIAGIGVRVGARHVNHAGTTQGTKTVGGSPGSRQLSTSGRSSEMISDGARTPMARFSSSASVRTCCQRPNPRRLRWSSSPIAAPGTGTSHIDLFCNLIPGQALVT